MALVNKGVNGSTDLLTYFSLHYPCLRSVFSSTYFDFIYILLFIHMYQVKSDITNCNKAIWFCLMISHLYS